MSSFNRPLVISGPSGTGKSTLLRRLFEKHSDKFGFSVSHTTREPRTGEVDGRDYYFVNRDAFNKLRDEGAFIEMTEFAGNLYGTSRRAVQKVHEEGRRCILDIEAQGVRQLKHADLNPVFLFIAAPDRDTLEKRLKKRNTDGQEAIEKRLKTAIEEMKYAQTGAHNVIIVNDDQERAYKKFEEAALGKDIESDSLPTLEKFYSKEEYSYK